MNWNKLKNFVDNPIIWFLFIFLIGGTIISESYNQISSIILFIFAILVWEYERKKIGK